MDFIGIWKVKKSIYPTEEGMKHLTKEEMIAAGVDEDDLDAFDACVRFNENGTYDMLVQIPADQIEAAKAEGAPVDDAGFIVVQSSTWKENGGAYFFEQDGEECPINFTEDGLLEFSMGMMLLEKIG